MNNTNDNYTIQRLTADRLNDLASLYKAVYGHQQAPGYFAKKYDTAYTGAAYIGFIAYCDDLPVAYYGVIPCFIEYDNMVVLAAQSGDTMTHPEHQKKGLFVQLAQRTYELCKSSGIQLVYGFPNQNSHRGLIKLGWTFTENLDRFPIPMKTSAVERIAFKIIRKSRTYKDHIQRVLHDCILPQPGLPNTLTVEGFGGVHRSEAYLEYKQYTGSMVIQAGSAKAWIKIKQGLIIGDLHVQPNDFDNTMDTLVQIARQLAVPSVTFQVSPGTQLHSLFAAKYKPVPSFPAGVLNISNNIPVDRLKFTYADIDIF